MTAAPAPVVIPDYGWPDASPLYGTIYMLHFDKPHKHARHYVGWTLNLSARLSAHRNGRGARLCEVFAADGIGFTLARTVPGDRNLERAIKHAGGSVRYCPMCKTRPLNGKWTVPAPTAQYAGSRW